jgi:polyhydroxyalkanoate synthase
MWCTRRTSGGFCGFAGQWRLPPRLLFCSCRRSSTATTFSICSRAADVYIIDWGTPGPEDRFLTFDDVCDRYLGRAVRIASRGAGALHLLGYCLGGTLTTIFAAARPERVASLTAVAAPIDFHDDGLLSLWSRTSSFDVETLVQATGNVPWQLMQASFHLLKPTLGASKAMTIVDRAWDDEFLDGMFALERWGSDNVSFPGACYAQYIERLYRDNALLEGELMLSDRRARLESIECPCHIVTFEHDHIVPWRSAAVLAERVSSADVAHDHVRGGHVGAMVSRKAAAGLWRDLSQWWLDRD